MIAAHAHFEVGRGRVVVVQCAEIVRSMGDAGARCRHTYGGDIVDVGRLENMCSCMCLGVRYTHSTVCHVHHVVVVGLNVCEHELCEYLGLLRCGAHDGIIHQDIV